MFRENKWVGKGKGQTVVGTLQDNLTAHRTSGISKERKFLNVSRQKASATTPAYPDTKCQSQRGALIHQAGLIWALTELLDLSFG